MPRLAVRHKSTNDLFQGSSVEFITVNNTDGNLFTSERNKLIKMNFLAV